MSRLPFDIRFHGTAANPVLHIATPYPNLEGMVANIDAALGLMPFDEDLERGSQEWRDLARVVTQLRNAKARLTTMIRKREVK